MAQYPPRWTGEGELWRVPQYAPRSIPGPIPGTGIFDDPATCPKINVQWLKHIIGVLDALDQPDAWEGDTDAVFLARQQIRALILAFASLCACEPGQGDDNNSSNQYVFQVVYRGGGAAGSEEDVGQVVTEIKWEDGKLKVYYGHCCVDEFDICADCGSSPSDPDDELIQPPEPPPENIACQKAYWIAQEFSRFLQEGYEHLPSSIYGWSSEMRALFRKFDLSNWSMYKLYQFYFAIYSGEVFFLDLWGETSTQTLACLFYPHLNGDDYDLSRAEYDALKSVKENLGNAIMQPVIDTAWDAINYSGFRDLAIEAQGVAEYDCRCPGVESPDATDPTTSGWYLSAIYTAFDENVSNELTSGWTAFSRVLNQAHDVFGFVIDVSYGGDVTAIQCKGLETITIDGDENFGDDPTGCTNLTENSGVLLSDKLRYAFGPPEAFAEIFPAGGYVTRDENGLAIDADLAPTSPAILASDPDVAITFRISPIRADGTVEVRGIRLLHNTNSPSHSV